MFLFFQRNSKYGMYSLLVQLSYFHINYKFAEKKEKSYVNYSV